LKLTRIMTVQDSSLHNKPVLGNFVPVRIGVYVPSRPLVSDVFYVPEKSIPIDKRYQDVEQNKEEISYKKMSQKEISQVYSSINALNWRKYHRRKPAWSQENIKGCCIEPKKLENRWLTESKDSFTYIVSRDYSKPYDNAEVKERGIELQRRNSLSQYERKQPIYVKLESPRQIKNAPNTIAEQGESKESNESVNVSEPREKGDINKKKNEEQQQNDHRPSEKQGQSKEDTPKDTLQEKQKAQLSPKPALYERTSASATESQGSKKEERSHSPSSNANLSISTGTSLRSSKLKRNIVDHGYVHVPLSKPNKENTEEEAEEPKEITNFQLMKQYEKFAETRKKIKKQQMKYERMREKYIDKYYQEQDERKKASIQTDMINLQRYLPPEGKPPFHNYGWGNQNPVNEENRLKSFSVNPRDVNDVYPHVITRREKTNTYEGWKDFLETTGGYKKYRPKTFYFKEFNRFDLTPSYAKASKTKEAAEEEKKQNELRKETKCSKQSKETNDISNVEMKKETVENSNSKQKELGNTVSKQQDPIPQYTEKTKSQNTDISTQKKEHHNTHTDNAITSNSGDIPRIEPPVIFVPYLSESDNIEKGKSMVDTFPDHRRTNSIAQSHVENMEGIQKEHQYLPLARKGEEQYDEPCNCPFRQFCPIEHKELNPKYYKNLPFEYTYYIRPAGLPTPQTLTTADCFRYFD
jgi:hypothetical protein